MWFAAWCSMVWNRDANIEMTCLFLRSCSTTVYLQQDRNAPETDVWSDFECLMNFYLYIFFSPGWHLAVVQLQPKQSVLCRNSRARRVRLFKTTFLPPSWKEHFIFIIFQCFAHLVLNYNILIAIFKLINGLYLVHGDCGSSSLCSDKFLSDLPFSQEFSQ